MLPFLEVTHLPSSSSFYSAILQPLGVRYLSAEPNPESESVLPAITYGVPSSPPTPLFQLRQVSQEDIRLSRIVLSAPTQAAVAEFHSFALRAHPDLEKQPARALTRATETRAKIPDFDGNTMEVAYLPPPDYPTRYSGSTVRKTQSTKSEASRILDWNYGVAAAATPSHVAPPSTYSAARPAVAAARRSSKEEPYPALRRSVTTSSAVYEPTTTPRQNSSGLSTGTVVGTLLGVAAGAALTYSMVKDGSTRSREDAEPPPFARRSTFPEQPFSAEPRARYVDVERNVEKVRHPSGFPPVAADRRPAPEYIARYSQAGKPRSREVDDMYDNDDDSRSRHSTRFRPASVRTRSEAASTTRKPLLIAESEHRSFVGAKHSNTPPITRSVVHRSHTYDHGDRESYVSTRSHRSGNTIRAAPPPGPVVVSSPSQVVSRSRAGSRVTTTTIKVRGSSPSPRSIHRAGSYASARNIPLPSVAGTRYDDDWDDDSGSVAPSDSISCVGSRRSGRAYH